MPEVYRTTPRRPARQKAVTLATRNTTSAYLTVLDWIATLAAVLLVAIVTVWTVRVASQLDSLSIAASATAVGMPVLSLSLFAIHVAQRALLPQASSRLAHGFAGIAALLSLFAGPVLLALAGWLRRGERLPFSGTLLQLCHLVLWAGLTFVSLGLAAAG